MHCIDFRQVYQAHDAQGIYSNTALQRMHNDAQAHQFGNQPREYTGDHYYERLKSMHRQRTGAAEQLEAERKGRKQGKAPSGYSPTLWKNFQMQKDLIEKKYENQEAIIGSMKSHAVRSRYTRSSGAFYNSTQGTSGRAVDTLQLDSLRSYPPTRAWSHWLGLAPDCGPGQQLVAHRVGLWLNRQSPPNELCRDFCQLSSGRVGVRLAYTRIALATTTSHQRAVELNAARRTTARATRFFNTQHDRKQLQTVGAAANGPT